MLLVALVLAGCAPEPLQKETTVASTDLTRYTEQGFLITPNNYPGEYQSIGYVTATVESGARTIDDPSDARSGEEVRGPEDFAVAVDPATLKEAVDALYTEATEMGADGIINFRREAYTVTYESKAIPAVRVSGFAIDRRGN
jgi:uncharacterized protein YbjQ (UPF0145 family)